MPLQELSTYYVKSYALTDFGLIVYGEEKSFTTYYFLPTVVTERITGFSEHFATINASYTLFTSQNEDCFIHEAGFCWSTHPNPTIDDNVVSSTQFSSFSGNRFSNTITDLGFSQTYYVRAFLSTNHGLSYGQVLTFNSYIDSNRPYGSLNGIFSVASNKKIRFSKGNLIYDNGVFRFADYQYDIPMEQWDLFGWATSGCPGSQSPTCTAAIDNIYGPLGSNGINIENADYDWCMYNPIENGGNTMYGWRVLTKNMWNYLLFQRDYADRKRSIGMVDNYCGLILLPDVWSTPANLYFKPDAANFYDNHYSISEWQLLEEAGAVFLPAVGRRDGTTYLENNIHGYYWTSISNDDHNAYCVSFGSENDNTCIIEYNGRHYGESVRAVYLLH